VTIDGGIGVDAITGSATRASTLNGGAGNDTITGGAAADVIDGGADTDTYVFSSAAVVEQTGASTTTGVVINLGATALTANDVFIASGAFLSGLQTTVASGTSTYLFNGESATNVSVIDTLANIENVTGTNLADYIVGSATANTITGGAGADVMTGGTGADTFTNAAATVGAFAGNAVITGADVIKDFTAGTGGDVFSFLGAGVGDANTTLTFSALATAGITGAVSELVVGTEAFANAAAVVTAIRAVTQTTGTLFAVFVTDADGVTAGNQSHTQVWFDADPNVDGGEFVVATFENITTLVGHNSLVAANFSLFA